MREIATERNHEEGIKGFGFRRCILHAAYAIFPALLTKLGNGAVVDLLYCCDDFLLECLRLSPLRSLRDSIQLPSGRCLCLCR